LAVRIRLTRVGATKRPAYRVIAIDKRRSRDGRALEILGFYDPLTEPATVNLNTERIQAWIGNGAQPSDTVAKLMRQAAGGGKQAEAEKPKRATRAARPRASTKVAKPKADTAAAAAPEADPAVAEAPAVEAPAIEAPATEAPDVEAPAADAAAERDKADA
jgi:small subunit ribosomal protein S16